MGRMRTMEAGLAAVATLAVASDACAQVRRPVQWAAAVEWRGQLGENDSGSSRRTGLAIRAMANGEWLPTTHWRIDGAYSQMQYDQESENGTVPINENGLEIGAFVRQGVGRLGPGTPYVLGGGIASLRMSCGIDSAFDSTGFVECGTGTEFKLGYGLGGGYRALFIGGWDWFAEARLLGNVTSAGGGRLLTVGFGAAF